MRNELPFRKYIEAHPHPHKHFFLRRPWSRRGFFQLAGGAAGSILMGKPAVGQEIKKQGVQTQNRARNLVFIQLAGAPTHVDTFDFKQTPSTPMDTMKPEAKDGIVWPVGIMPKLANNLGDLCIVRSVRSWALAHTLAQVWTQIGRSPAAALGDIAPNMGTIVAVEKESERQPGQVFPTFLALNSEGAVGSGYMPTTFAPLRIVPETTGMPDTINPDGQARFDRKFDLMQELDGTLRTANPYSGEMQSYDAFYTAGRGMMFNPSVDQAFRFTTEESQQFGSNNFGNACLVASKVLAANGGTRYIQITLGGWDMHQNIYTALPNLARTLDNGVSALLNNLKASGALGETLVVVMGEFGRTTGAITAQNGRDHFLQQFVAFAGAGVRGGRAIGSTNAAGSATEDSGWSRQRDIRVEDVEATIYSAMGIDWTTVRYDDPFKRGFYYVPESHNDLYGPINELWA